MVLFILVLLVLNVPLVFLFIRRIRWKREIIENEKRIEISLYAICVLICLDVVIIGGLLSFQLSDKIFPTVDPDIRKSLFGNSFGAVNALISGLAFAGVIINIIFQCSELKYQREDLQSNTNELERQRAELKQQNDNLELQRFDDTLFNMFSLLQHIVNDLKITADGAVVAKGRETFRYAFELEGDGGFRKIIEDNIFDTKLFGEDSKAVHFNHYFRYITTILSYIDDCKNNTLGEKEKYIRVSFLRSMLSRYELVWMFYYGISDNGHKIKTLIEKYSILKYLDCELLPLGEHTEGEYDYAFDIFRNNPVSDFNYYFSSSANDDMRYCFTAFASKADLNSTIDIWAKANT